MNRIYEVKTDVTQYGYTIILYGAKNIREVKNVYHSRGGEINLITGCYTKKNGKITEYYIGE